MGAYELAQQGNGGLDPSDSHVVRGALHKANVTIHSPTRFIRSAVAKGLGGGSPWAACFYPLEVPRRHGEPCRPFRRCRPMRHHDCNTARVAPSYSAGSANRRPQKSSPGGERRASPHLSMGTPLITLTSQQRCSVPLAVASNNLPSAAHSMSSFLTRGQPFDYKVVISAGGAQ